MEEHGRGHRAAYARLSVRASQAREKGGVVLYSLKHVIILGIYFKTLYVKGIFKYQTVFLNKVTFPMGKSLCRTRRRERGELYHVQVASAIYSKKYPTDENINYSSALSFSTYLFF